MAIKNAVNNLRNRPKADRAAVASGIATTVVALLFLGWAIIFFHNMRSFNAQTQSANNEAQSQLDTAALNEAKRLLTNPQGNAVDQLQATPDQTSSQ